MEELTREQKEKYAVLQDYLRSLKSVAVAFPVAWIPRFC